ncbi:MAG: hypothetical protein GY925_05865 [Actinomycetia bacterium]|nr:hypothetical protein [Actinomycetes bacterium]
MAAEYDDLDTQAADGVPGATWANQTRQNQEALIEPPACRWAGPDMLNSGWSQSLTTATWARVRMLTIKAGGTQPGPSAPVGGYLFQTDAGGGLTAGAEPWRDTTNDTSTGTYSNVDTASETYSRSDAWSPPRDGLYMIGAACQFAGSATAGNYYRLRIVSSADGTVAEDTQPYLSSTIPVRMQCSALGKLSSTDWFYVEAYNGDTFNGTHDVGVAKMWAYRAGRIPT